MNHFPWHKIPKIVGCAFGKQAIGRLEKLGEPEEDAETWSDLPKNPEGTSIAEAC